MTPPDQPDRPYRRLINAGWICLGLCAFYMIGTTMALWPVPLGWLGPTISDPMLFMSEFVLTVIFFLLRYAIVAAPIIAWLLLRPPRKLGPWFLASVYVAAIVYLPFTLNYTRLPIRRWRFEAVAERGNTIVDAIERYREANGDYPASLHPLVPEYIEAIPWTGLMGYPAFEYLRPPARLIPAGEYQLTVPCRRVLSDDSFFYWPSETYPDSIYGGPTERIRNWAYVLD